MTRDGINDFKYFISCLFDHLSLASAKGVSAVPNQADTSRSSSKK